ILPQVSRVLCVWFPRESHRYSRRFPELYVLPIVGQWSTGSPSPSIYRTAPTGLPVLIQTWVTASPTVLLIFIEPEPAEDFREFTKTCRIFNTRRFTDLRISRHHRVFPVYFELTILCSFPISRFLRLSRVFRTQVLGLSGSSAFLGLPLSLGLLISRYLDLQGTSPVFVSAPLLANRTNGDHHLPRVFRTLTLPVSVYIERTVLGKLSPKISRPVSLPHDQSLGLSPINITRLGSGRIPSLLYPPKSAPARPRERLSLGSARNTGSFDFTRTGNPATLTDCVTMCRTVKRLFHVYSKAPHGSAYSSLTTLYYHRFPYILAHSQFANMQVSNRSPIIS